MLTLVEYLGAPPARWALARLDDGAHVVRWIESERGGVAQLRRGPYDGVEPVTVRSHAVVSRHRHREPALARVAILDGLGVEGFRRALAEPVPADPRRYFWLEQARDAMRSRPRRCVRGHLRGGPNLQAGCRACRVAKQRQVYAVSRGRPDWSEDDFQHVSDEIYEKSMRDAGLDPWPIDD